MTHSKIMGGSSGTGILPVGRSVFFQRNQTGWKPIPLILSLLIQLYRWTLSPALVFLFGANSGCRFTPTCSEYAREAIQSHGAMKGSVLAVKRICRCHPFGPCGHDPVPEGRRRAGILPASFARILRAVEPAAGSRLNRQAGRLPYEKIIHG
jgi:uncharacterized protein